MTSDDGRPDDRPPDATRDPRARAPLVARPGVVAGALAAAFLGVAAVGLFGSLPADTWPHLRDSIKFEYLGWYVQQGHRLYRDVWAVKPPLAFEITAVLAALAGESVVRYHVLNLLANGVAVVLGAAAAAGIVHELTDDFPGAVVGGVAVFTLPYYTYRALIGFKSKYFVVAAGLGCLYLAYRERPVAAGVAGALAVGFWQLAVVFPACALGLCWRTDGRDGAVRVLAAGAATGGVVLLPVVLWGALPAMVAETLLTPLIVAERHAYAVRVRSVVRTIGTALPVALVGLAGIGTGLVSGRRREWPLAVAVGWFTLQLLVLDFDNTPDVFPWLAVVAVGVGLAVAAARGSIPVDARVAGLGSPGRARTLAAAVLALAALSAAPIGWHGVATTDLTAPDTYDTDTRLDPDFAGAKTYNATEKQYVYWNRVPLPTCRALGAYTQTVLVNRAGLAEGRPWYEAPCGRFGPMWRAVRVEYGVVSGRGSGDGHTASEPAPASREWTDV
ncbi:MAG: DolP-mannose mannosyltransferase [Haloferacaceae archaeon]